MCVLALVHAYVYQSVGQLVSVLGLNGIECDVVYHRLVAWYTVSHSGGGGGRRGGGLLHGYVRRKGGGEGGELNCFDLISTALSNRDRLGDVVWFDRSAAWHGMELYGIAQYKAAWCGMAWHGKPSRVWCSVAYCM